MGIENDVDADEVSDVNFDESDTDHMITPKQGIIKSIYTVITKDMISPRGPTKKESEQITQRQGIIKTVST